MQRRKSKGESVRNSLIVGKTAMAAIYICDSFPLLRVYTSDASFLMTKVKKVIIYNCYTPPRWSTDEFQHILQTLISEKPLSISFVMRAIEWSNRCTNLKVRWLVTLLIDNRRSTSREGIKETMTDLQFVNNELVSQAIIMTFTRQRMRSQRIPD